MPKYNRGIKREHYDAALQRFADGRWICDPGGGRIWSASAKRWMKPTVRTNGYCYVSVLFAGRNRSLTLSRVIWEYVHGPIPDLLEVNHKDGNKLDNGIANLELLTTQGNQLHALATGLYVPRRGSAKGRRASITEAQAAEILDLCRQRVSQYEIARRYGISQAAVSHINQRKTWTHVSGAGSSHRPGVKLSDDQVREIRELLASGQMSQEAIGRRYGVSQTCISDIKRGRRWADLN